MCFLKLKRQINVTARIQSILDFKNLNKESFESDIKETKWDEILELKKGNVDLSSENFLKTFDSIIDKHLPLRKLTIQEKKLFHKNLG